MAFKDLPSWAKGTVAIVGTLTIVVGGYYAVKGISNIVKNKGVRDSNRATSGDLKDLNKNQSTAQTITESQAEAYSSALVSAMEGLGTDETAIKSVFSKLKNDADVLAVMSAFGTREIGSGSWFVPNYRGDLAGALRDELDSAEIDKINSTLASKNIKFRF